MSKKNNTYIEDNQLVKMKDVSRIFYCPTHGTQEMIDIEMEGRKAIVVLQCGCEIEYKGIIR